MNDTSPVWIFDLDDTLHNTSAQIFPLIDAAMTDYVARELRVDAIEADRLRRVYWQRYGATMLGLVRHHGCDPHHFLHHTHQIPALHEKLVFDRAVRGLFRRLPGRKVVCSNGPRAYVDAVLDCMRIGHCFEEVFGIEQLRLAPKPHLAAFRRVLSHIGHPAAHCVMVEDSATNLRAAKTLGMRTVWISRHPGKPAWVDVKLASVVGLPRALSRLG
ncbi:pyrimidine 5'-nucleotidase [Uliginosibacterium sp. sgz301328]|uniref:pyrimidine 5'-nucleotidase n=1 Tax=Uliginosibacterium sp. sgz301328 TaxID=3243764 RepID=UPI00359D2F1A